MVTKPTVITAKQNRFPIKFEPEAKALIISLIEQNQEYNNQEIG